MPNSHDNCGFCKGDPNQKVVACELCIVMKIVGICTDCHQPFERLEARNSKETRCVSCQVEYRAAQAAQRHNFQRYKAQLEANQ